MRQQVPPDVKKRRVSQLRTLGRRLRNEFLVSQFGRRMEALVDSKATGLTSNYIRVRVDKDAPKGQFTDVVVRNSTIVDLRR